MSIATNIAKRMFDTIIRNGGGTFNQRGEEKTFLTGYIVSLPDMEYMVPLKYFNYAHIEAHVQAMDTTYNNPRGMAHIDGGPVFVYIGAWVTTDGGVCDPPVVYLDASVHFATKKDAIKYGKMWNQIAIYDCRAQDTISL